MLAISYRKNSGPPLLIAPPVSKQTSSNKILLVLGYWDGDRAQAMKLARLLADTQPSHSELADFLFVSRFDCAHDKAAVEAVSRKFNVFTHKSRREGKGWPGGCNSVFWGACEFFYHKLVNRQIPRYKAIFNMGPDCAPMTAGWLTDLHAAWDSFGGKVFVAGAMIPGEYPHINGDSCFLSSDFSFLKWLTTQASQTSNKAGWDWSCAPEFGRRGWRDIPWLKSLWNTPNFTEGDWNAWTAAGVKWIHGVKGDSLLDLSRRKIL